MRLLTLLKLTQNIFIALFIIVLIFSASTFYWPTVPGKVNEVNFLTHSGGSYPTARRAEFKGTATEQLISYSYYYKGQWLSSNRTCICIPFSTYERIAPGVAVNVYVFPLWPSVSVLRSMVDIALLAAIAIAAFSFGYLRVALMRAFRIHVTDA